MDVGLPLVPKLCLGTKVKSLVGGVSDADAPPRSHSVVQVEVRHRGRRPLLQIFGQSPAITVHESPYQVGWPISTEIFGQARIFYHGDTESTEEECNR